MNFDEYRKRGKEMVDYIADYLENIRNRRVYPDVKPGYLQDRIPNSAPLDAEPWEIIFADVERHIMPGMTHWQSPHMHAYFPALNSFPSLLGDMLSEAINCLGFTWASSPACTELEILVTNWLGKMIGLPDEFLHGPSSEAGGGVIQTTASEATLVCLLAGRTEAIARYKENFKDKLSNAEINSCLVAYSSDQAHSSVEKACLIGLVKLKYIESDDFNCLRVDKLIEAIEMDKKNGLIPFFVCATLGTTGACSFDSLEEIGPVCKCENIWLHVDAAYAGSAFICPEFRKWLKGINYADSLAFNPSKWLMVNFDCNTMWEYNRWQRRETPIMPILTKLMTDYVIYRVKRCKALHHTFNVDPLYLQHENSGHGIDYMHWQIPLSKKFRALKLWFVIRCFGIKGLQHHIREGVRLARKFEKLVLSDDRFDIPATRHLGLVVFCLRAGNHLTELLLKRLNSRGNVHCVPAALKDKYVIRFTVTSQYTTDEDILTDWIEIKHTTNAILEELEGQKKIATYGSSLLLSNTPMSPKIVNGSFAAIFEKEEQLLSPWTRWIAQHYNQGKGTMDKEDSKNSLVHKMFFKLHLSPPIPGFMKNSSSPTYEEINKEKL